MSKPQTWQVLDALVATTMIGLAAYIGGGLL
jgi:arginine exporter protein ArgO